MKMALILILFLCLPVAYWLGDRHDGEKFQRLGSEELKVSVSNLTDSSGKLDPQLREYLKARVYALLDSGVRREWVNGKVDFGPIDWSVLEGIRVIKDSASVDSLYESAMKSSGR